MENDRQGHSGDAYWQERGSDRRVSTCVAPPPYATRDGVVSVDRRSAVDRRATWIREFSLEAVTGQEP